MKRSNDLRDATTSPRPRDPTSIDDNETRLPRQAGEALAPQLDSHVASFCIGFHQYLKQRWLVEGPQSLELRRLFDCACRQAHRSAEQIGERMTAIGAVPSSSPSRQVSIAYVQHESEGCVDVRSMLVADHQLEERIAQKLCETIRLAVSNGDHATEMTLKRILVAVEQRALDLKRLLGDDTFPYRGFDEHDQGIAKPGLR
jgi:DNA-binding ferritin-like protein